MATSNQPPSGQSTLDFWQHASDHTTRVDDICSLYSARPQKLRGLTFGQWVCDALVLNNPIVRGASFDEVKKMMLNTPVIRGRTLREFWDFNKEHI